ncbi:MAG: hypothetical protein LBP22_12210 [Deltaproteobacteria bacterium]|jgi:hypothetical protein|nr:hypothetical protein [Deltaproteobacteria bacterium]
MFLKKLVFFLLLAGLAVVQSQNIQAQSGDIDLDAITPDQLTKEAPLNQQDIDNFIKFMEVSAESIKAAQKDPENVNPNDFEKQVVKFIQDNKIPPTRMRYLMEKIQLTMVGLQNPDIIPKKGDGQDYLIPSAAEKKLIEVNMEKLMAALQAALN